MSKQIQIFKNDQFGQIRTLTKDGEPWFVLKDVCESFGETNYRRVSARLDDDEKGVSQIATPGGKQNMTIINESGLYSALFAMQPEKARGVDDEYIETRQKQLKAFKHWVTAEVLPSIRKTGGYVSPQKAQQRLGEVNSAARIIRQTLKEAGMAPQFVAVAMKSLYAPVGVEIPLDGITLNKRLFDAAAIARRLGVISKNGNPHSHAISAIIAQVDVLPEEKELVPFQNPVNGHSGTNVQYTESVVAKVNLWLERHGYPEEINYRGKQYVVRYGRVA